MAVTQLLSQNDNTAEKFLKNDVGHSMIPLTHSVQYSVDVDGAILPCCLIETVPSDRFEISNEVLLRQLQPLKVPQMTRYTLNTAYYYCSNRLGWKKWGMFMDQANKGRANVDYSFELPTVFNVTWKAEDEWHYDLVDTGSNLPYSSDPTRNRYGYNQTLKNTLHTYFDISLNHSYSVVADLVDSKNDLPLAFPFFDYQMICRDFYTNIDRIADNPTTADDAFNNYDAPLNDWAFTNLFPVDEDEIRLKDGPQYYSGFTTGDDIGNYVTGFVLDKVRYHDVRDDYFTSSKRAPMRGEAPTVDTTIAVTGVDASDVVDDSIDDVSLIPGFSHESTRGHGSVSVVDYPGVSNINKLVAGVMQDDQKLLAKTAMTTKLQKALEQLKVTVSTSKAINAAELRLLSQLTVWQELNMLHKPTYNDFLNAHYNGIKVGDSLVETPQYIGGTSQVIQINEVLQTSESTDSSKLGTQAAVAHSLSSSGVGSFYCPDYGFIIGVMYILPDMIYKPAMPRWASRRTVEDYYFPEFANLSMQATLNKELFFSNDSEWNNQALGYVGAYDEMRTIPNYCAGEMLDDNKIDLQRWALLRKFDNSNKPAINQTFLSAKGNIDKSAWSAPNEPKFMFQIANYIKAVRPMPYIAIPKAL